LSSNNQTHPFGIIGPSTIKDLRLFFKFGKFLSFKQGKGKTVLNYSSPVQYLDLKNTMTFGNFPMSNPAKRGKSSIIYVLLQISLILPIKSYSQ